MACRLVCLFGHFSCKQWAESEDILSFVCIRIRFAVWPGLVWSGLLCPWRLPGCL